MNTTPHKGERIAKVISRAGLASRREAERLIEAGRVAVNGKVIDRAALNVTPQDRVSVDGRDLKAPEPARLWLYHKPAGLVTTTSDEQGRPTIFDELPEDLPRVMSCPRQTGCAATACASRGVRAMRPSRRCAKALK